MNDDTTLWHVHDVQGELQALADLLADNDTGQLALFEVDDCVGGGGLVPCPARGTHRVLTECWACWCDVTRGAASRAQVLRRDV